MKIGKQMRIARKEKGYTQKQLGELLGVSQAMVAAYENDRRNPTVDTVEKIADALGIAAGFLLQNEYENLKEYEQNRFLSIPESEFLLFGEVYNDDEQLLLADFRNIRDPRCTVISEFVHHYRFHHPSWRYPNLSVGDYYRIFHFIDNLIESNNANELYFIDAISVDEDGKCIKRSTWETHYYQKYHSRYINSTRVEELRGKFSNVKNCTFSAKRPGKLKSHIIYKVKGSQH